MGSEGACICCYFYYWVTSFGNDQSHVTYISLMGLNRWNFRWTCHHTFKLSGNFIKGFEDLWVFHIASKTQADYSSFKLFNLVYFETEGVIAVQLGAKHQKN